MRHLIAPIALTLVLSLPVSGAAQTRSVRVEGNVLWIAGQTLALGLDQGSSVRIELTRVPQGDYQGLAQGEHVVVTGVLSNEKDNRRIIGTSIRRRDFLGGVQAP